MIRKLFFLTLLSGQLASATPHFPCLNDGNCDAGYLKPSMSSKNALFYWFFASQDGNKDAPLILWLQGGPGCSSMLALFTENGPFTLTQNGSNFQVGERKITWNQKAHMLFLDQPVGTGYSVVNDGNYITTDKDAAKQALFALLSFYEKHPQLRNNSLFIAGESYGGHWVPWVTQTILEYNKQSAQPLPIRGIMVGDPLIDAEMQVKEYVRYALQTSLIPINQIGPIQKLVDECIAQIRLGNFTAATVAWNTAQYGIVGPSLRQPYNIQESSLTGDDPDMDAVEAFLNSTSAKSQIGIPSSVQYQMCNANVYYALNAAFTMSVKDIYADIAQSSNLKTLIYCGNMDPAVPCAGLQHVVHDIYPEFDKVNSTNVVLNGQVVAWKQATSSAQYYNYFNAGHMVPEDQSQAARNMIYGFIDWALGNTTMSGDLKKMQPPIKQRPRVRIGL